MKALFLVLIGVIAAPALSYAQDSGFYAGATLGQTKLRITSSELDGSANTDETGFKLIGGYRFNPYFAIESAYFNPGQFSDSEDGTSVRLKTDIFQLSAVAQAPVAGPVSVFARFGGSYWDSRLTASDGFFSTSLSDSGTEFNWGFGTNVAATERLNIRLEFDETKIDAPIEDLPLEWRLRFLQLGLTYTF